MHEKFATLFSELRKLNESVEVSFRNFVFQNIVCLRKLVDHNLEDFTLIVKSVYCANNDASSAIDVNASLVDSSNSNTEYEFFRDNIAAKTQVNASPAGINLEAGDQIKIQAATGSNKIQGVINYAQIDRSQENG